MTSRPRITTLVGCQNISCAAEVSYPLDLVRLWEGQPICRDCFYDLSVSFDDDARWKDLPPIKLEYLVE